MRSRLKLHNQLVLAEWKRETLAPFLLLMESIGVWSGFLLYGYFYRCSLKVDEPVATAWLLCTDCFFVFQPVWFKGSGGGKTAEKKIKWYYQVLVQFLVVETFLLHFTQRSVKLPGLEASTGLRKMMGRCSRGVLFHDICSRRALHCQSFLAMHCMFPQKCCHLLEWLFKWLKIK